MEGVNISELTPEEVDAHDTLIHLFGKLGKLSRKSRKNVYRRWEMLHLIPTDSAWRWEMEVRRVTGVTK